MAEDIFSHISRPEPDIFAHLTMVPMYDASAFKAAPSTGATDTTLQDNPFNNTPARVGLGAAGFGMGATRLAGRGFKAALDLGGYYPNRVSEAWDRNVLQPVEHEMERIEQLNRDARVAQGEDPTSIDLPRLTGEIILSPANYRAGMAGAKLLGEGFTLPARVAESVTGRQAIGKATQTVVNAAAGGGVQGLAAPVDIAPGGDYWGEKGRQLEWGTGAGAISPAIGKAAARLTGPVASKSAKLLQSMGVDNLTAGQQIGGAAKKFEDGLMSTFGVGDAITAARDRVTEKFNRVAINQALKPIGRELPEDISVGREGVDHMFNAISERYKEIMPDLKGAIDPPFRRALAKIDERAQSLPEAQLKQYRNLVDTQIFDKWQSAIDRAPKANPGGLFAGYDPSWTDPNLSRILGTSTSWQGGNPMSRWTPPSAKLTGADLKGIESELGAATRGYRADPSWDNKQLGRRLGEVQTAFHQMLARQNDEVTNAALRAANEGWAKALRVGRAAGSTGGDTGVFSPAQLARAVRAYDSSPNKIDYQRGKALLQDFSDAAKEVIPSKLNNSGTADRAMLAALVKWAATGGPVAMLHTGAGTGLLAAGAVGMAAYSQPGVALANKMLAAGAEKRAALAAEIRRYVPRTIAPGALAYEKQK